MYQGMKVGPGRLAGVGRTGVMVMAAPSALRQSGRRWTLARSGRTRMQEMGLVVALRRGCRTMGADGGHGSGGRASQRAPSPASWCGRTLLASIFAHFAEG